MANAKMWGKVESVLDWSPWLRGLVTAYLPSLILLIINLLLGPFINCLHLSFLPFTSPPLFFPFSRSHPLLPSLPSCFLQSWWPRSDL